MRILSFDIGTYAVKAVELDVTFGRVELGDYLIERVVESDLPEVLPKGPNGKPADGEQAAGEAAAAEDQPTARQVLTPGQVAALRRILHEKQFKYDRLVVNMPKSWTTTRMFQFPTRDRKTIQSSLNFELDDDIPFAIEDIVYDFATLTSDTTGSTVFTAVMLKGDLTALLSELQMLGLDPDSISIESWGVGQLLKRAVPKEYQGRPVCVVNLGNRYTSIHMLVNESPVLTHVSTCAGLDVTKAIAQSYGLAYDEAEKAKIDGAFLLTQVHLRGDAGGDPITKEQKQFASVIADALMPVLREIKQTLMSYKAQYKMTPRAIFITGGTSLIPNLQLYLEEQLQLPVFPLAYMSQIVGETLQLSENSEAQISCAAGLAVSSVKPERGATINLRKDDFAKRGGIGAFDLRAFKRPLKYVAASLAFVYINLIVQGVILSARSSKQQDALSRAMKSVLGPVPDSVIGTYKNSPTALKSAVNKEIAKYKVSQVTPPKQQVNAFDILNKVSSLMPTDMVLDTTSFQIKDGKARMTGIVDSINAPARIAKALEAGGLVTDAVKEKAEEDPKSKKVRFEVSGKVADGKAR